MDDHSCSKFDPYEVGLVHDVGTFVEAQWRKETRPKRMRPHSSDEKKPKAPKIDKRIHQMDAASFDTSSHHTVDYLLDARSAKSFTFGKDN